MSLTTWFLRRAFKKSDDKRDAGLKTPDDIERKDGILYGADPKWQALDVYRPKGTAEKLPVIVSVHGGGWAYGDKERYQYYCMDLAQRGFAVVNFTYRLAPEFKFPSGIGDTHLVFSWVLNHSEWFDLSRVFAVGDSAGAHMLTIYSAICTNPQYAAKYGIQPPARPDGKPFVPSAVGLNCGIYQISLRKGASAMTRGLMKALLPHRGSAEELDLINPIPYVSERFPRAFIMTANHDALAGPPAQAALTRRLMECGVPFVDKTYGTKDAPLDHVFHCNIRTEAAKLCNDDECRFFLQE
ncbi:MAG: alpha/beta hydrolase [Clostridia bacterium]|nr:alpha/beta hydrolase [Clostridia bacterium]